MSSDVPSNVSAPTGPVPSDPVPTATHSRISPTFVGIPIQLGPGEAVAILETRDEMIADEEGLIHGGFTFGLADYAAMLAVNHPYVVLGAANTRFLAPVRQGERLRAYARVTEEKGKKRVVKVEVSTDRPVLEGELTCFVLERHVLTPPAQE